MAEFAINSSINTSTGETPFFLNYGRHPRTPVVLSLDFTVPAAASTAELDLPPSLHIHLTFHDSLLRPFRGTVPDSPGPVAAFDQGVPYYTVERILTHRGRMVGRKTVREYLVKWEGYTDEHNSWEPDANFTDSCAQDAYLASRRAVGVAS
jgi:hypothetical protein